jgi:hypothetical protein
MLSARDFRRLARPGGRGVPLAAARDLEAAFSRLSVPGFRDEHVMLTALVRHVRAEGDPRCMLGQFRVGSCRADLVVVDATSTAWEIKSDLDGLGRLPAQLAAYGKLFAGVSVLTGDRHLEAVRSTAPGHVGIGVLAASGRVDVVREPTPRPELVDPATVAASLRREEALAILRLLGVPFPRLPNTAVHGALVAAFSRLEPAAVHGAMVETLARTRDAGDACAFADALPAQLSALAFTVSMEPRCRRRVLEALVGWAARPCVA